MTVLAIDPGPEQSAWVLWDGMRVLSHGKEDNWTVRSRLTHGDWLFNPVRRHAPSHVALEWIASYGMAVGAEVFDTARWIGHYEAIALSVPVPSSLMVRRDVKMHLCGQSRAKDSNIRQALIDRFGGKEKAIGKKANQGPLYGLKADTWQALALAVTWLDLHGTPSTPQEEES